MASHLKKAVSAQESVAGVLVQKLNMRGTRVALRTGSDAVTHVMRNASRIFKKECADNFIDVTESIRNLVTAGRDGAVFVAWKIDPATNTAEPVGIATLSTFRFTSSFSTDKLSEKDETTLRKFLGYTYLDCLCSKQRGVGKLLTLHAFVHTIRLRKQGLIALSYTRYPDTEPQSFSMFKRLGFRTAIKRAEFVGARNMHGSWMVRPSTDVRLLGISESVLSTCTRSKASGKSEWRC